MIRLDLLTLFCALGEFAQFQTQGKDYILILSQPPAN